MKEKWREELVCIETIAAKTHNIPGKIRGGLRSNKETRASAEMLCTTCCALWRSAECCNVLCIHGETTQLLVFKNPFAKLENLINICVS